MELDSIDKMPNLMRLARDSRTGSVPVSLRVKERDYAVLAQTANAQRTSVGSIINELIEHYLQIKFYPYMVDDREIKIQTITSRLHALAKRVGIFNDQELSALILAMNQSGIIVEKDAFAGAEDIATYVNGQDCDIYIDTAGAPIIDASYNEQAHFEMDLGSATELSPVPTYILSVPKRLLKITLILLSQYAHDYNQLLNRDYTDLVPCVTERQFRNIVSYINANPDVPEEQYAEAITQIICGESASSAISENSESFIQMTDAERGAQHYEPRQKSQYLNFTLASRIGSTPKITKCGRLRHVNHGKFNAYFSIDPYIGSDGKKRLRLKYLPEVHSDSKHQYYKSGTVKMGGFFNIRDICIHWFGEIEDDDWHYDLEEEYADDDNGVYVYVVKE
ncbi:hypothetical protein IKE79_01475 [Candidatus Saccharibacteria bacterium]|nr:hypothetical protein [Candidatus Saccharibacteria bacterium]